MDLLDLRGSWDGLCCRKCGRLNRNAEILFFFIGKKKQNYIFSFTITQKGNHQAWKKTEIPWKFPGMSPGEPWLQSWAGGFCPLGFLAIPLSDMKGNSVSLGQIHV